MCDGMGPPWVGVSPPRGETARAFGATSPQKRSKPAPVLGIQAVYGGLPEPPECVLGRFCGVKKILSGVKKSFFHMTKTVCRVAEYFRHMKNIPGGMTKTLGCVTKSLGGVTKTSGGPAGKFCHMKKSPGGQKKSVFGRSREFCGASRKFRGVSFKFFGVAGKFCGVAQGFCDVSGRFRDASGAFCHVARKFCGVAGRKPRTAARSQAPTTAEPRHPKNLCASGDRSSLRCVSRAATGALV